MVVMAAVSRLVTGGQDRGTEFLWSKQARERGRVVWIIGQQRIRTADSPGAIQVRPQKLERPLDPRRLRCVYLSRHFEKCAQYEPGQRLPGTQESVGPAVPATIARLFAPKELGAAPKRTLCFSISAGVPERPPG